MKEITRLHVPSHIKYTKLVEDFTYSLSEHFYPHDEKARQRIVTVMNEVFTNIVRHSDTTGVHDLVRFQLEIGSGTLHISVYDKGPGIKIDDQLPPYRSDLIGHKRIFRQVVDGIVSLHVTAASELSFFFEEKSDQHIDQNQDQLLSKGHGYGLSIITRIMDSLTYTFVEEGCFEWKLTKRL